MTTYSQSDLATRVMRDLGLVSAEETPSAEDMSYAIETIESEIELLSQLNMPIWNGSSMAVPSLYMTALSRRLGLALGPAFGVFGIAEAMQAIPLADQMLQRLATVKGTGKVSRAEYY